MRDGNINGGVDDDDFVEIFTKCVRHYFGQLNRDGCLHAVGQPEPRAVKYPDPFFIFRNVTQHARVVLHNPVYVVIQERLGWTRIQIDHGVVLRNFSQRMAVR